MELHYNDMIHQSSSSSSSSGSLPPSKPPFDPDHSSHASFPIIAVAIIGIFATILLLLFYYIFVIKCCLNWHRIDILRRFSISRNSNHHHPPTSPHHEPTGLHESIIRSIPIFRFQKQINSDHSTGECAVCLSEFQHNEKLRMIPNCAHVFHIDCIDVWLQNNPNCPLCRNSISISIIPPHFPVPEQQLAPSANAPSLVLNEEEHYVVLEFNDAGGAGEDDRPNKYSGEQKMGKKVRKKHGNISISSMGDECIDDHELLIQPIRRSFSMDSASDRQLYLAVEEINQRKKRINNNNNNVDVVVHDEVSDTSRGFFSFGHARSAILPLHFKP